MIRPLPAVLLATLVVACGAGSSRVNGFEEDAAGVPSVDIDANAGAFASRDGGRSDVDAEPAPTTTTTTTIYVNTDDSLYSMDPATKKVALIGTFAGMGGGTDDTSVTDCAVDATGGVWVNTQTAVYRAQLPAGGTGTVTLSRVAAIAVKPRQKFYALAFAPAGVLGAAETLVGGDGAGELWSIDTTTGETVDLGGFGSDQARTFALSGDIVFYTDGGGKATGLATIRSCAPSGTSCTTTNDYLAGIDMAALAAAFTSGTRAPSLLSGIYGGSSATKGLGVGHGELFGLGAWQGSVFGFQRGGGGGRTPSLLTIDTKSGAGTVIDSSFAFTNGWSGAGVTTKVTINVPPPPAGPK